LLLVALVLFGLVAGCAPKVVQEPTATSVAVAPTKTVEPEPLIVNYPGDDWGYPSPFGFYPRGPGYTRMSLIFDTLAWKDEKGVIPWLADEWKVSDHGLKWTFKLHPDVTFHDGKPLTAEDVAFTYGYFLENMTSFKWNVSLDKVERAEVVGEGEVAIYLAEPVANFLVDTAGSLPILPKHIWEKVEDPAKFSEAAAVIGSGPFKLAEYNKEEARYVYEANTEYFKGKPTIDRLIFTKVLDGALALKTGAVDAASFWGKEIDAVKELEGDSSYDIIDGPSFWVLQMIFNTGKAPLDNVAVRRAIAHAIDRAKIVEQVTHGGAIVANLGIISPKTDWCNPDLPAYGYDPQKAKSILEAQGLTDLQLTLITTAGFAREAELVKADIEAAGIQVELKTGDRSTVDGLLREGNFDLAINGHGAIANPSILSTPSWPASVYKNEAYDKLFQEQSRTIDEAKRHEMVGELQEMLAEDLPVLTLYHPKMRLVYDPSKVDTWFYTAGGISKGIPIPLNKLIFLER